MQFLIDVDEIGFDSEEEIPRVRKRRGNYATVIANLQYQSEEDTEFDIIDGPTMKNFLAENLVMNYSNIEIHKLLF